jgi:(2Fe-2S) ferredoxin
MPRPPLQILVCVKERPVDAKKPCCGSRRALDLYRRFKDRVRQLGLKDEVLVTRTGCLHHCSSGATVVVWPHNHWYGTVDPDDVDKILEAAAEGREIARLRIPDLPWE